MHVQRKVRGTPRFHVRKTYHRPPGLSRDFRGWAVMDEDRELSVHSRCTDAYAVLERREP